MPGLTAYSEVGFSLEELTHYIDWTPFFHAWELAGKYPKILDDDIIGDEALADAAREERERVLAAARDDAAAQLSMSRTELLADTDRFCVTFLRASSDGPVIFTPPPSYEWYITSKRSSGSTCACAENSASKPAMNSRKIRAE